MYNKLSIMMIILIVFITAGCTTKKIAHVPLQATDKTIPDGEKLKYEVLNDRGQKYSFTIVTKISDDIAEVYAHYLKDGSGLKFPDDYKNYQTIMFVSLKNGSLLHYFDDNRTNAVLENSDEPAMTEISVDYKNGMAICTEQIWNGFKFNTRTSHIKVDPDYPVWNWNFIMFMGIRFLKAGSPGIIYLVVPQYIKTSFFGSFIVKGKEILNTKAGQFNTIKLGFALGDPFLGRLTDQYVRDFYFWVDEDSGILVKEVGFETTAVLKEKGVW